MARWGLGLLMLLMFFSLAWPAAADFHQQLRQAARQYDANELEESLRSLREGMSLLWNRLPFNARQICLLEDLPSEQDGYRVRADNVYKAGETLVLYLEPVGFQVRREKNLYLYHLEVDFTLKDAWGHMVGGQRRFSSLRGPGISFPDHLSMVISYQLIGLTPGDYQLETLLRDVLSGRNCAVKNAIRISGAGED